MPSGAAREYGSGSVRSTAQDPEADARGDARPLDLSLGAHAPIGTHPGAHAPIGTHPGAHAPIGTHPGAHAPIGTHPGAHAPIAITVALVASGRRALHALPERRLDEVAAFGAERAAERCRTLGIRVTFLVPGATSERHADLIRRLARSHEIGLFGFDPARPGPDDPLRACDRLAAATGVLARWYARPFGAPVAPSWLDAARLDAVPEAASIGLGPMRIDAMRAYHLSRPMERIPVAGELFGHVFGRLFGHLLVARRAPDRAAAPRANRADGPAAVHLPLLAGGFAGPASDDLPRAFRPAPAPELARLVAALRARA
jgi:hypothetical protein